MQMFSSLDNREIASIILIAAGLIWGISYKTIRLSIWQVLKSFFQWKIIRIVLAMLLYSFAMVFVFYKAGLWDFSLTKDTIFWLGAALVMLVNFEKIGSNPKKEIIRRVKLIVVLEFIVGLYTFSVWGELVIIPIILLLTVFSIIAGMKKETAILKKIADFLLACLGIYFLIFAVSHILRDPSSFWTIYNLKTFLLPIVFTACYLPFIYLIAVYGVYDILFMRLDKIWLKNNRRLSRYVKRKILFACFINLKKINKFAYSNDFFSLNDKSSQREVDGIIDSLRMV